MTENNEIIEDNEKNITEEKETEVKWEPVAKIDTEEKGRDPYEFAPESVRKFHRSYVEFWLEGKRGK